MTCSVPVMPTTYVLTEVAHLHVGDEFIDANDIPHVATGFTLWPDNPGLITVISDQLPFGRVYDTCALVYRATVTRYVVRCEDGAVRHPGTFASKAEAERFANWEHACTNSHTFETTEGGA